jgi:Domain of unknown function (DUF4407)
MSDDDLLRDQSPSDQPPGDQPRARSAVIARRMRKLTGVREELLSEIPAERTRYTALAAVMICTASIGGFSMFFTLSEVLGKAEAWFLPIGLFWSVFILCLDCWLVSSTAGSRWHTRVSVLVPRLLIAAVFGVVIAEPLVLRVFQTGIVAHVERQRHDAIDNLRTALVDCNPVPGITVTSHAPHPGCAGMVLNLSSPAAASLARLQALRKQESGLLARMRSETEDLSRLEQTVNDECNGVRGAGLTGLTGNGPACRQDQHYVTSYLALHPIAAQNAQIARLNHQIGSLQGGLAGQQGRYSAAIAQAIKARLAGQTQPGAPIGMAERFQALSALSGSNSFIAIASLFVRLFFILIDCLPVLVKFISGSTPYDRLVDIQVASAERRFDRGSGVHDAIADEENTVTLHRAKADAAKRKKEIDLETLRDDAQRGSSRLDAVEDLFKRKLAARRSAAVRSSAPTASAPRLSDSYTEYDQGARNPNGSTGQAGP